MITNNHLLMLHIHLIKETFVWCMIKLLFIISIMVVILIKSIHWFLFFFPQETNSFQKF